MDRFHAINTYETIHQITNFSRLKNFNIFMVVEEALLKKFSNKRGQAYHIVLVEKPFIFLGTLKIVEVLFNAVQVSSKYLPEASVVCNEDYWWLFSLLHRCSCWKKKMDEVSGREKLSIFIPSVCSISRRCRFLTINKTIWFPQQRQILTHHKAQNEWFEKEVSVIPMGLRIKNSKHKNRRFPDISILWKSVVWN